MHHANILFDEGNVDEAETMWQRAFETFNKLNEIHAATISVHMKLAYLKMQKGPKELDDAMYGLFISAYLSKNGTNKTTVQYSKNSLLSASFVRELKEIKVK